MQTMKAAIIAAINSPSIEQLEQAFLSPALLLSVSALHVVLVTGPSCQQGHRVPGVTLKKGHKNGNE